MTSQCESDAALAHIVDVAILANKSVPENPGGTKATPVLGVERDGAPVVIQTVLQYRGVLKRNILNVSRAIHQRRIQRLESYNRCHR